MKRRFTQYLHGDIPEYSILHYHHYLTASWATCSSVPYGGYVHGGVELSLQRTKILFVKYEVHMAVDMKITLSEMCPLIGSY
jgi:hypothetical protein